MSQLQFLGNTINLHFIQLVQIHISYSKVALCSLSSCQYYFVSSLVEVTPYSYV